MKAKVIILLALAVLLMVSSVVAIASYVAGLDQPLLKTPIREVMKPSIYSQQNNYSSEQINSFVKEVSGSSKDLYDSRGSGLLSGGMNGIPTMSGRLTEIPGPFDFISAMIPAGYNGSAPGLGHHDLKNILTGASLV